MCPGGARTQSAPGLHQPILDEPVRPGREVETRLFLLNVKLLRNRQRQAQPNYRQHHVHHGEFTNPEIKPMQPDKDCNGLGEITKAPEETLDGGLPSYFLAGLKGG